MPEYPATRKKGIAHFIYKATPLLSIDADQKTVHKVINQYMSKVSNAHARHMLYLTCSRFNSRSIKLVNLKLHNYNFLEKRIIRKMEKHFIKHLNVVALDTVNTPTKISSIYVLHIIGLSLN